MKVASEIADLFSLHKRNCPLAEQQIRFDDGDAYDQMMGAWSRLVGNVFLDWLSPQIGLRWIDVGCGNGAFTEMIVARCGPADVQGIDPSEPQLAFARSRAAGKPVTFQIGDGMELPFAEPRFDAAVMALVIFFVPDPSRGVTEMMRVVRPGGSISAYAWDIPGGGLPMEPILVEVRALGGKTALPPSADISRMTALHDLWTGAGLESVETKEIVVTRTFTDFEAYWANCLKGPNMAPLMATMSPGDIDQIKNRVQSKLPKDSAGRFIYAARANAVKGHVPR